MLLPQLSDGQLSKSAFCLGEYPCGEFSWCYAYSIIQKAKLENPNIKASIDMTDFFAFDPPEDSRFDLIYDYT